MRKRNHRCYSRFSEPPAREFVNRSCSPTVNQTASRSRVAGPYKKNESAHVEQKNGAIVRQVVGYDRYDSKVAFAQLARVDRLVRLHANFFRPVQKLVAKSRNGARTRRRYDVARPPYQRLCDAAVLTVENRKELERQYRNLKPLRLRREIDAELARLWQMSTPTISLEPDRGTGNAKLAQAMAAEKMVACTDARRATACHNRGDARVYARRVGCAIDGHRVMAGSSVGR